MYNAAIAAIFDYREYVLHLGAWNTGRILPQTRSLVTE